MIQKCKEVLELSKIVTDTGVVFSEPYELNCEREYIASANPKLIQELIPLFLEAVEVIGFYANERSWGGYHRDVDTIMDDSSKAKASDDFDINLGGRRAREFLKKVDSND